jgi:hypothetical protein
MKHLFLGLLFSTTAEAWTLNNNFGAAFASNRVKVFVDEGTVCPTNGVTYDELAGLVKPAVDDYWNRVPTSNLRLAAAGFSSHIPTINRGRLCSPTDEDCIAAGQADPEGLIPAVREIVIACNSNTLNFGGGNVLAVTIPNKFSGKKIKGAVILINDSSGTFGDLSRADKIGVIAHEIGHAIGLGHSDENAALMYFRTVSQRRRLGQDDVDGVSFLYPIGGDLYGISDDGLVSCGSVGGTGGGPAAPLVPAGLTLGLVVLLSELRRLLKRAKRRSPL